MCAGRRHRAVVRRSNLGGTPNALEERRRMEAKRRTDHPKRRYRNAQFCGGTHALWPHVSCRRRGSHRSSNGSQRAEPGNGRYLAPVTSRQTLLRVELSGSPGPLLGRLFAASLESAAVFLVDDFNAAPVELGQSFRLSPPARRTGICDKLSCSNDQSG